ncbi:helix-turn-helix transcriptional regulator [Thioalkalivibrio sulfidiphilus]|uniref:helix-turn-helix transcriptional regulator n=1 Tax=Thioalkalivibrio sulfidiphilus TaxID=1033854 RepID=UPI000382E93A|nr:helix-turn-helix domain-containing protein [Thioalkalivibrio sulfidiphilus]
MHDKPRDYLAETDETSEYIHTSPRTLIRWRNEGKGPPYIKAGHRVLYRKRDVDAWLEGRKVIPVREQEAA